MINLLSANKFARLHLLYTLLILSTAIFLFAMIIAFIRWNLWNIDEQFKTDANHVRNHIRDQLAQNETVLIGLGSFLTTKEHVNIAALDTYSSAMMARFSHISMFQIAEYVEGNFSAFQTILRMQGVKDPVITRFGEDTDQRDAVESLPVIFVAPSSSKAVLGLDLSTIDFIRRALPSKADSEMTISEPIDLFEGDRALVIMQSIPSKDVIGSSYIALILIKQDMLFPQQDIDKNWTVSIRVVPPSRKSFEIGSYIAEAQASYSLHKAKVTDSINFSKYTIQFELSKNITWKDLDLWKLSLFIFMVLLVLAVLCLIYFMHFSVEQQRDKHQKMLYQQANYDLLTNLPNRFYFEDTAARVLLNAERQKAGVLLLFVDLNGFKSINDNLGHEAGDRVLAAVGATLTKVLRQGDLAARLGGDEFVILIDNVPNLTAVLNIIEKVRRVLAALYVEGVPTENISGSLGFAYSLQHGYDLYKLLQVADKSMYGEKHYHRQRRLFTTI